MRKPDKRTRAERGKVLCDLFVREGKLRAKGDGTYEPTVTVRENAFRAHLYSLLMEGAPCECCPLHATRVSDAELDAAIAQTTMSREDYLECERIVKSELAQWIVFPEEFYDSYVRATVRR